MCVCVYAPMHACMHAFKHVCMYVCKHVCMYVCLSVCVCLCLCLCERVFMYACMHGWIYGLMQRQRLDLEVGCKNGVLTFQRQRRCLTHGCAQPSIEFCCSTKRFVVDRMCAAFFFSFLWFLPDDFFHAVFSSGAPQARRVRGCPAPGQLQAGRVPAGARLAAGAQVPLGLEVRACVCTGAYVNVCASLFPY